MVQTELGLQIANSPWKTAPDSRLWPIAIHEAGHAVVAVYYELPFTSVRIQPKGAGWLQLNRKKLEPLLRGPSRASRYASKVIVMGYAGYIAELKVSPYAPRSSAKPDEEQNAGWLWETTLCKRRFDRTTGSYRRPTEAEIERVVTLRAHRLLLIAHRLVRRLFPVIELVAKALIEKKRLTGGQVGAIAGPTVAHERTTSCPHGQRGTELTHGKRTMTGRI
jgi:hypothetical protein